MTHTPTDHEADRIVRDQEAAKMTGTSRTTRWRLERDGKFPERVQVSPGAIGWLYSELQEWIQERATHRGCLPPRVIRPVSHP